MSRPAVYLDHNASSPLLPEARTALLAALEMAGNPSSVHAHGRALRASIETARGQVAKLGGAERDQVVFTGSATEAITQAIVGGVKAFGLDTVIVSAGEHAAVLKAAEASGARVVRVGLERSGLIDLDQLASVLGDAGRALVAVHSVNNETGVVQPVGRIGAIVGPTPHYLFIDAAQAFGKRDLDFASSPADLMAVGAHKIGGPAGVGALLMKRHAEAVRLIPGGGQETGRRGGTEPAALIAAFGAAAATFPARYAGAKVDDLTARLEAGMLAIAPEAVVFGAEAERIGNTVNVAVPGLTSAVLMMGLDLAGVSVSSGSACSSGKVGPSHVLAAMGVPGELAECGIRVSLGWSSAHAEVAAFLAAFETILRRHRSRHGQAA